MTLLTSLYDHVMPHVRAVQQAMVLFEARNAINEFLRRSRTWRVATAPISMKYATVTGVTNANPAVVTAVAHGFANGDVVLLGSIRGPQEIQGHLWTITLINVDSFSLNGCDTTALAAFSGQGRASVPIYTPVSPIADTSICDVLGITSPTAAYEDSLSLFGSMPALGNASLASPADLDNAYPGWRCDIAGIPMWVHMHDEERVRLVPAPGEALANALTLDVALELSSAASSIDSGLYRAHHRAWADGTLRNLFSMKEKPWTDGALATYHAERFENAVYEAAQRARKGKVKSVSVARAVSYGGM
jgi:hypothetical protein